MDPVAARLLVFTRFPEPGRTKTRLIPALGAEGAADLQRGLTEHTLAVARRLRDRTGCTVEVRGDGASAERFAAWLGDDVPHRPQRGDDLGARLLDAFADAFADGARRVLAVGIDCPDLGAHLLEQAVHALARHDVVLGPATDGGYTLVGLAAPAPALFADIPWGTDAVFARTMARADRETLSVALLPPRSDIDRPEDVDRRRARGGEAPPDDDAPRLTVVLPALDAAGSIAAAVESVLASPSVEAIVVDGGSGDGTVGRANAAGATVLRSPAGRARQMNAGAHVATSDRLLFLHGDTRLPAGYAEAVHRRLDAEPGCLGAFRLGIDAPGLRFRLVERLANLRSRLLDRPYGDQALFITRARFDALGGFPDQPFLEDLDFVIRAARSGPVRTERDRVLTSPERWRRLGVLRTMIRNQRVLFGRRRGQSPERLARLYRTGR